MQNGWKRWAKRALHAGVAVPGFVRPAIRAAYRVGVFVVEGSALLRKLLWIEPVLRSVCESVGTGLRAERLPYMRGPGRLVLGSSVNLSGRSCFYFMRGMGEAPRIVIGDRVFVGNGCTLAAAQSITVGSDCLLAAGVRIHDNDGHPLDPERRRTGAALRADECAPVVIEDNVWIGADAVILKGVHIGRNSVIGTGAVVTSDVPRDTIAAGNPARVVRSIAGDGVPL